MAERYHVVSQEQGTEIAANGRVIDVMRVSFVTLDGTPASVTVPLSQYAADVVNALILDLVERIEGVAGL